MKNSISLIRPLVQKALPGPQTNKNHGEKKNKKIEHGNPGKK